MTQVSHKPCLYKVDVVRQGVEALMILHDDKRNAVDQAPCFISSGSIEIECSGEQVGVHADNGRILMCPGRSFFHFFTEIKILVQVSCKIGRPVDSDRIQPFDRFSAAPFSWLHVRQTANISIEPVQLIGRHSVNFSLEFFDADHTMILPESHRLV